MSFNAAERKQAHFYAFMMGFSPLSPLHVEAKLHLVSHSRVKTHVSPFGMNVSDSRVRSVREEPVDHCRAFNSLRQSNPLEPRTELRNRSDGRYFCACFEKFLCYAAVARSDFENIITRPRLRFLFKPVPAQSIGCKFFSDK